MNLLQQLEAEQVDKLTANRAVPPFQPGDTVRVSVRVVEGERERAQAFEGVCIGRKNAGVNSNFTTVDMAYSTGAVVGLSNVGGLIGNNAGSVTNSYWDTQTSGQSVGIGAGTTAGATGLTSAQFRDTANFVGWSFVNSPGPSGWVIVDRDGTFNNAGGAAGATRPFLASEYSSYMTGEILSVSSQHP